MSLSRPGLKQRATVMLTRQRWLTEMAVWLVRVTRPRYTAGVVGVVFNGHGDLLLVEHVFHPANPWGLPGGWMERDEAPEETLRRELVEEVGLAVTVIRPLVVTSGPFRHHLDIAFLCHADGEVTSLSSELSDYRWVPCDAVPPLLPFHQQAVQAACAQES